MSRSESSLFTSAAGSSSVGLLRKTTIVSLMTLLSRLLGFARDVIFAVLFGAGGALDAFVIAFKIPNFFRRLFGEGAFSQAFVPVLSELKVKQSQESLLDFVSRVAGCLSVSLLMVVAFFELAAPVIITLFAPGFLRDPARYALAVHLLRWTAPYIFFISLTAMAAGILNTYQRFALPAFAPVLLNAAFIFAAVALTQWVRVPIYALGYGVLLGGVLQLLVLLPALRRLNMMPVFKWGFSDPQVKRVLKLMVPALFGVSVAQISLLIDNCFASFLPAGSISWLYYSDRMTYLPLGVFGVAIATVVLPNLSRQLHEPLEVYSKTVDWALRTVLFVGVPSAVGLMVLSRLMLTVLFQHGAFSAHDVLMSSRSLWAFSFGLPAFMLIKVLASAFYSRQNIRLPVKVAAWALLVNLVGNVVFIHWLAHAGLALSTSLAAYCNALMLFILLRRHQFYFSQQGWGWFVFRLLCATACMVVALGTVLWFGDAVMSLGLWAQSLLLLLCVTVGVGVYMAVHYGLGWRLAELR